MKKKAFLVGINKYQNPDHNLRGCVNDVKNLYSLLTNHFTFSPDEIRVLLDERATFDNIMNRLKWLILDANPGDVLFFSFSGHGSQVRDRNGDELDDGLDEILCPYDLSWDRPFLDDYLGDLFKTLPKGVNLMVLADCCHSGTITRMISDPELQIKARRIIPPFDIEVRSLGRDLTISHFGERDFYEQDHVLLSGCQDHETSADAFLEGDFHGALTFNFCKMVRTYIEKKTPLILKNIYTDLVRQIKQQRFTQNPKLTGPKRLLEERILFHNKRV